MPVRPALEWWSERARNEKIRENVPISWRSVNLLAHETVRITYFTPKGRRAPGYRLGRFRWKKCGLYLDAGIDLTRGHEEKTQTYTRVHIYISVYRVQGRITFKSFSSDNAGNPRNRCSNSHISHAIPVIICQFTIRYPRIKTTPQIYR